MTYALGAEELAGFRRDGFIAINELVSGVEITRIRDILFRLHQNNVGFNEGAQFDAAAALEGGDIKDRRFPQILHPHTYARELTTTEFFRVGMSIAKQVLGDKARFKMDISFMKPPRIGSDTPWHQDEAFGNPAFDQQDITIWLAVTSATSANSCMSFIPGSNHFPVLEHQPMGGDPRMHALECIGAFDNSAAIECPLPAGGCTIHMSRTLHYAGPNASNDVRLAYALLFDTPPVLREIPRVFSWNQTQHTERAERNKRWRRRGGAVIHVWRERHRLNVNQIIEVVRRIFRPSF
jgi:ectoine hydroxylase-related dioxygenase (phytanoyl-CoA dioxygenase family)